MRLLEFYIKYTSHSLGVPLAYVYDTWSFSCPQVKYCSLTTLIWNRLIQSEKQAGQQKSNRWATAESIFFPQNHQTWLFSLSHLGRVGVRQGFFVLLCVLFTLSGKPALTPFPPPLTIHSISSDHSLFFQDKLPLPLILYHVLLIIQSQYLIH